MTDDSYGLTVDVELVVKFDGLNDAGDALTSWLIPFPGGDDLEPPAGPDPADVPDGVVNVVPSVHSIDATVHEINAEDSDDNNHDTS